VEVLGSMEVSFSGGEEEDALALVAGDGLVPFVLTSKLALEMKITEIVLLSNRYILLPFQNIRCFRFVKKIYLDTF
jgi:hypothetical protein